MSPTVIPLARNTEEADLTLATARTDVSPQDSEESTAVVISQEYGEIRKPRVCVCGHRENKVSGI